MTEEEKDKLIALSDLNREDNIKYISSEAQGIAIALDSDRYAPTLCKLERAYICGRRKSEEQIKEIENYFVESAGYGRDKIRNFMDIVNKALEQKGERITELEKENAELKSENQKWKDEWQEQVQKAADEGYARTLQTMQLTKAKELLKEFVHHYKAKTIYIENMKDLLEQAEQFLSEVE